MIHYVSCHFLMTVFFVSMLLPRISYFAKNLMAYGSQLRCWRSIQGQQKLQRSRRRVQNLRDVETPWKARGSTRGNFESGMCIKIQDVTTSHQTEAESPRVPIMIYAIERPLKQAGSTALCCTATFVDFHTWSNVKALNKFFHGKEFTAQRAWTSMSSLRKWENSGQTTWQHDIHSRKLT